jgi:two-component system, CitB family, response regulator MalR
MIRVVLVDDEPMVAELNRIYVERVPDFKVVASARSAAEGLGVLKTQPVDLLLLDIFMAGQTGMDLMAEIRRLSLDVDVIFVTAARDAKTIGKALKLGAVDYLIKPFEFERLQQALEGYRATHRMVHTGQPLSQTELDAALRRNSREAPGEADLPKGLDRATLARVCQAILDLPEGAPWFRSEDLARQVGISRVSVRKYLEFLCGRKALRMEPSYGGMGRPVHRFCLQDSHGDDLRRFL